MSSRKLRRTLVHATAIAACAGFGVALSLVLLGPEGEQLHSRTAAKPDVQVATARPTAAPAPAVTGTPADATVAETAPSARAEPASAPVAEAAAPTEPSGGTTGPGGATLPGGAHLYAGAGWLRAVPAALFLDVDTRDLKSAQLERSADVAQKRGTIVGAIERVDARTIAGWAYAWDVPAQPLSVEVFVDGVLRATVTTSATRERFASDAANPARGRGWECPAPELLADGDAHWVEALASRPGAPGKTRLARSPWRHGGRAWPEGAILFASERSVFGWARDPARPDACPVELLADGKPLAVVETVAPARSGELLARARALHAKPEEVPAPPAHGRAFLFEARDPIAATWLQARVEGSVGRELHGSPRRVGEPKNRLPYGGVTFVNESQVSGWAADPDILPKPVAVDVFIDGAFHERVLADKTFAALPNFSGLGEPEHAFVVTPPDRYRDGKAHTIQFFAVNQPEGANPELPGSPTLFVGKRNAAPVGWFDVLSQDEVRGWAYDPDAASRPIDVEVWIDGALWKRAPASERRQDLVPIVSPEPDHGYVIPLGDRLKDGKQHVVRVFAVNSPEGPNPELAGSPKELNAQQPWFGIGLDDAADSQGIKITSVVPDSPAARAGLVVGDVIRAYDGQEQKLDAVAFVAWAKTKEVGERVAFKVWHDPLAQPQPGPGAEPGATPLAAGERLVVVTVGSR